MEEFSYTIDRSKRRHLYLCIREGKLLVKAPNRMPNSVIRRIVEEKSDWIRGKLQEMPVVEPKHYCAGELFPILGKTYPLVFQIRPQGRAVKAELGESGLLVRVPAHLQESGLTGQVQAAVENFYRDYAKTELLRMTEQISSITGLVPEKVTIRKMSASWGRCSASGRISLNWKLICCCPAAIEYVILHELCHLKIMDHSNRFWRMVALYMPDYQTRKKLLVMQDF